MKIINIISSETFDEIMSKFQSFRDKVLVLCQKHKRKGLEEWLDNQDVCLLLSISPRTLQDYRNQGKIPFIHMGGKILYRESDIVKMLEENYCKAWQ